MSEEYAPKIVEIGESKFVSVPLGTGLLGFFKDGKIEAEPMDNDTFVQGMARSIKVLKTCKTPSVLFFAGHTRWDSGELHDLGSFMETLDNNGLLDENCEECNDRVDCIRLRYGNATLTVHEVLLPRGEEDEDDSDSVTDIGFMITTEKSSSGEEEPAAKRQRITPSSS
jgi:hypothetical protein